MIRNREASLRCDHGQRRAEIVQSLLADVFQGRLQAGQHLVTRQLAERFGVSDTPIREALISLAGIGIIELVPNRGAIVRKVAGSDVKEICQVRRALECEAVRCACGRMDPEHLRELATQLRAMTRVGPAPNDQETYVAQARALDDRLHDIVASGSGNAFLAGELGRLKLLFRAFRDVAWEDRLACNDLERLAEEAHEHLAIVDALVKEDKRKATAAMSRHIMTGGRHWSRAVKRSAATAMTTEAARTRD